MCDFRIQRPMGIEETEVTEGRGFVFTKNLNYKYKYKERGRTILTKDDGTERKKKGNGYEAKEPTATAHSKNSKK